MPRKAAHIIQWSTIAAVAIVVSVLSFYTVREITDADETNLAQQSLIDALAIELDTALNQGADVATPEQVAADVADDVADDVSGAEVTPSNMQGERGDAGPPGEQGEPGLDGRLPTDTEIQSAVVQFCVGDTCTGPVGTSGIDGAVGPVGATGVGEQGPIGPQGEQGFTGEPGPAGPQGETGLTGAQGGAGPAGPQGVPGVSPTTLTCVSIDGNPQGPFTCSVTA